MNKTHIGRLLRMRRSAAPLLLLAGALVTASFGVAFAATTQVFYLKGPGVPVAPLAQNMPASGSLPNYDPGRDDAPGLLIQKGGGQQETDPTKFQMWLAAEGELVLDGPATLTLWSAMKDFNTEKKGQVKAYLLDCNPSGSDCSVITDATRSVNPWSRESGWVARTIDFGTVGYTVAVGRSLAVKLVVTDQAHDDMWFAYDTASYASALNVRVASPPPTTTTTTTTTTTAPPTTTTTTTTTAPPATTTTTTTTAPPTTTTTTTTTTSTTTTTTPPPAVVTTTTVTTPATPPPTTAMTTTTTPAVSAGEVPPTTTPPDDPTPAEDIAMGPIPVYSSDAHQGGFTSGLLDSLDLAIPPAVTSSLLSPLLLLQSIVGAFLATGQGLLIPGLLLLVGVLLMDRRRRRHGSASTADGVETSS